LPVLVRRTLVLASVALLALLTSVRVHADDAPDLTGVVRLNGRPQKDVVLWLDGVPSSPSARKPVVLDQRNLTFSPHVLAVRVGSTVSMPNNDRVFHNVFSFRDGKRFDLGLYPVGRSRLVTFDKPGVSRIFCNIHPNMAAYVVAVDSEVFAVSDPAGVFSMAAVPAGTYTYHAWRAGHDVATGTIVVGGDRRAAIDLP
jgi:plastocyanin